eukprot:SAG31_NODE_3051_length_4742_cov_35.992031_7_plen_83_part_00
MRFALTSAFRDSQASELPADPIFHEVQRGSFLRSAFQCRVWWNLEGSVDKKLSDWEKYDSSTSCLRCGKCKFDGLGAVLHSW